MAVTTVNERVMELGLLLLGILALSETVCAQTDPCMNETNPAIFLPQDGVCLVPIKNVKGWVKAQSQCETDGGDLYRLQDDGRLSFNDQLSHCLAHMPSSITASDFWIGAVSFWSRHWFWVNGTLVNPIRYMTSDSTAFYRSSKDMCSNYLSVDLCVFNCNKDFASYTVVHREQSHPCCFCSYSLDTSKVKPAAGSYLSLTTIYNVAESRTGRSNLIELVSSETYSGTETLCATVDSKTDSDRMLGSQTCFSEAPFLCGLGTDPPVKDPQLPCDNDQKCQGIKCRFRVKGECVQLDNRPMTWFLARAECLAAGGNLWTLDKVQDMKQVKKYLTPKTKYWVGATDHEWNFSAGSNVFGTANQDNKDDNKNELDYQVVRCGHMFWERFQWKWADTRCDQEKSYICRHKQTTYTSSNTNKTVLCPWPVPPLTSSPPVTPSTGGGNGNGSGTGNGNGNGNGSVIPEQNAYTAGSSYPIVPIIAACIAASVILLCAIFMFAYSRRRKWLMKKWRQTRDYVWPFWASSPTYLAPDHTSDQGFDSLSTGHTGMHSDSGSLFASGAFVFPDPAHLDGAAHKSHVHEYRLGSKDGSRRNESLEKMAKDRLLSRSSLNSGTSRNGGGRVGGASAAGGGFGVGVAGGADGGSQPLGVSVQDENLMSASYASLSPRAREYMTLSAHMNIHDDFESANGTTRRKPEVALVTNDVDLNFTVNHAYARSRHGSRQGSVRSSERGVDEIDLPSTSTVQIPTRTVEESIVHY